MLIVLLTLILSLILNTLTAALCFYALKTIFNWNISNTVTFLVLLIFLVLLDNYYVPALFSLNATITIGNEEISKLYELGPNAPLGPLCRPYWYHIPLYLVEGFVALFIIKKMNKVYKNA